MHNELYADGIGEITVTGSVVRVDLMSYSTTERDANNQPVLAFRQRVILPIGGFANSVELMQKALNGLIEAGAVRRNAEQQMEAVAAPAAARGAPTSPVALPRRNASLNFP